MSCDSNDLDASGSENFSFLNSSVPFDNHDSSACARTKGLPRPKFPGSAKRGMCLDDNDVKINDIPLSPILPVPSPGNDSSKAVAVTEITNLKSSHCFDNENGIHPDNIRTPVSSVPSPARHQIIGNDDMRQQLLVQRTFNYPEDKPELLVSSPHSYCESLNVKTSSPKCDEKETRSNSVYPKAQLSPFLTPYSDNASDFHSVFQTPVRGRHHRHDQGLESTPTFPQHSQTPSQHSSVTPLRYQHSITPRRLHGALTPSSTASPYMFTPGRNFYNPFEDDSGRLHLPVMSPGLFQIGNDQKRENDDQEPFWSVEQAALMMPVDIKESDLLKQHFYLQKKDKEKDAVMQSAIDKFFSSEYILPSPWSEKSSRNLPRTPSSVTSVSSQTVMSVPPDVDLFAELGGKFMLPDSKIESTSSTDGLGNSFIRRKLLHQLNENDSPTGGLGSSPPLPSKSPISPSKHETPQWDRQTPHKKGSGHFSSSPIREPGCSKDYEPMSESDLLASPELSPIAGRGRKSIRSSDIFYSHQDLGSPREIMQLDFSSILDEPDELENVSDKVGALVTSKTFSLQQQSEDNNSALLQDQNPMLVTSSSNINEDGSAGSSKLICMMGKAFVNSGLSAESTGELMMTVPYSVSSQDTGYQTASMQNTVNQDTATNSIQLSQDTLPLAGLFDGNTVDATSTLTEKDLNVQTSLSNQFKMGIPSESGERRLEENWFTLAHGSNDSKKDAQSLLQSEPSVYKGDICRIRKIKTMSDMRRSKEKRGASRNLTQSFNDEDRRLSFNGSNEKLNESLSLSSSMFDSTDRADVKLPKSQTRSESTVPKISPSVWKEKLSPDCVIKETFVNDTKPMTAGKNCLSSANLLPSDKRSFEDIGSTLEIVKASKDSKFIKLLNSGHDSFQGDKLEFSLGSPSALTDARTLLGRSEALRRELENSQTLESDTFYQLMSEGGQKENAQDESVADSISPKEQSKMSSQSSFLMESVKKKINSVEGAKLGSEIAAEILRRAGDDLAQLNDLT